MKGWVCEYCHKESEGPYFPIGWELVMGCAICGDCIERARREHGDRWLVKVHGGEYADGKPDPRA
jgi:hypothetical protein